MTYVRTEKSSSWEHYLQFYFFIFFFVLSFCYSLRLISFYLVLTLQKHVKVWEKQSSFCNLNYILVMFSEVVTQRCSQSQLYYSRTEIYIYFWWIMTKWAVNTKTMKTISSIYLLTKSGVGCHLISYCVFSYTWNKTQDFRACTVWTVGKIYHRYEHMEPTHHHIRI